MSGQNKKYKMKSKSILAVIIFGLMFLWFQKISAQTTEQGTLTILASPGIDSLVRLHTAYNEAFPIISGFRIQIFYESGNQALDDCEKVQEEFSSKYDNIKAYIIFAAPYYRVRVGDFRTRLEAEKFLQRISRKYPNAWVIKDEINLPVLLTN